MKANRNQAGFTLLEVVLAVAILLLISVALSRFTDSTIQAAQISVRNGDEDEACSGLRRLLTAQLAALPQNFQSGALVGMMIKSNGGRRDALQMICPSGNALLTPDAKGLYQITLMIREIPRGSGKMVLGLQRQPWTDDDDDDDDDNPSGSSSLKTTSLNPAAAKLPSDWVSLMDDVTQIEIAYFDSRLNGWVDRWTDSSALPNLVRVRLTLGNNGAPPYEIVQRVPGGGIKALPPPVAAPVTTGVSGTPGADNAPGNGAIRSVTQ
jgi:prepilin-type N-terminal cleavage/methylation domain-containing protein